MKKVISGRVVPYIYAGCCLVVHLVCFGILLSDLMLKPRLKRALPWMLLGTLRFLETLDERVVSG